MRIAMVSHAYPTFNGGYKGEFVHGLASALVSLGHEVFAIIPWEAGLKNSRTMDGVKLEPYFARDSVSYGRASNTYIRFPRPAVAFSLLVALLKLRQVIRKQKIEVVHAHWAIPMGFVAGLAKILTDIPVVITMHGRDIRVNSDDSTSVPTLWYVKPFLKFAFHKADRLITVSHNYYDHARRAGAPLEKLHIIHNGINRDRFFPSAAMTSELRRKYGINPKAKVLLSVGSLDHHKGFDILLRALPSVLDREPQIVALIVGDGPLYEDLIALRARLNLDDKVIFAGRIPNNELPPYNNMCNLFVMPSREESFGIAAVEAMACGKPVIATKVGGLPETIDDGQTGLLVETENITQLADTIIGILQNESLAAQLGDRARHNVETDFNWINVVHRTLALYEDIL